jgi:hypothetical protein
MVLKAMTEGWEHDLNIRKSLLCKWRKEIRSPSLYTGCPSQSHAENCASEDDEDPGHIPTDNC